jgi:hypothetical protein
VVDWWYGTGQESDDPLCRIIDHYYAWPNRDELADLYRDDATRGYKLALKELAAALHSDVWIRGKV